MGYSYWPDHDAMAEDSEFNGASSMRTRIIANQISVNRRHLCTIHADTVSVTCGDHVPSTVKELDVWTASREHIMLSPDANFS